MVSIAIGKHILHSSFPQYETPNSRIASRLNTFIKFYIFMGSVNSNMLEFKYSDFFFKLGLYLDSIQQRSIRKNMIVEHRP